MAKKEDSLVASDFQLNSAVDDDLRFRVKTTGDIPVENYCRKCLIYSACFGERGAKNGKVKVKLDAPIVANLTNAESETIPCGAGIEIIRRRSSRKNIPFC